MHIYPVIPSDLEEISSLRPDGWADIAPWFRFYLANGFCSPYKLVEDGGIAGSGVIIFFDHTAWLAHVIVRPEFRRRGFGAAIVRHLLGCAAAENVRTVSLIATDLGFPVYEKAGFRVAGEYCTYSAAGPLPFTDNPNIFSYNERFREGILRLDAKASGEDRGKVISQFLEDSLVYADGESVRGFYLPSLGEGLVIAEDPVAGKALMLQRFFSKSSVLFPAENAAAVSCPEELGLQMTGTVRRMIYGRDLSWRPEMMFGRIAGNMG